MRRTLIYNPVTTMTGPVALAPTAGVGFALVQTPLRRLTQ